MMMNPSVSPTADVNLQTVTQTLVRSINALEELRNIDANDAWRLACDLKRASRAYAMQVASDKAYNAAYAAAEQVNELDKILATLQLDEFMQLFKLPFHQEARCLPDAVKTGSLAWRRSHNDGFGEHPRVCEEMAELLPQAFKVLAAYCRYDDFLDLFPDDDRAEVAPWLDNAAMAMHIWAEARDYRNQLKTAFGIA